MVKDYVINGKFRELLIRLIDDAFGQTEEYELYDIIPFEEGEREVFIEDGRCFVRHNLTYATFFFVENNKIDNYQLISRIVNFYNIELEGDDERAKAHFVEEIKSLLLKEK